ncbi:MAG: glycogen-binding domain-containing protein [Phycisphaerae bacterium]|nr:glycogen-binding domain-containing protein [Phycisphaerae bacterium]
MVTLHTDGHTEFRFYRPYANRVFLSGDFNGWRSDQLDMVRQDDGYWVLRLPLQAGDYRFRYIADGQWYTDFSAFGVEPSRFGLNSIVHVPEQELPTAIAA